MVVMISGEVVMVIMTVMECTLSMECLLLLGDVVARLDEVVPEVVNGLHLMVRNPSLCECSIPMMTYSLAVDW